MEIKQIIVDELPNSCLECHLQHIEQYGSCNEPQQEIEYWCEAYEKEIESFVDIYTRPTWCPLVIENECVWVGIWKHKGKHDECIEYKSPHTPAHYHTNFSNFKESEKYIYCHVCGRKIRYEEE